MKLHYPARWRAGGYALILFVIACSLAPEAPHLGLEQGDKLGHFLAYGSLMFWFAQLAAGFGARLRWAATFVCMGIALEFIQRVLGYRSYDAIDMLANSAGVLLGWLFARSFRYAFFARVETALAKYRSS